MLDRVTAGRTLNFTTSVADYPASDGWTLNYAIVPRSGSGTYTLAGAADSADPTLHRVQASAATTAAWAAGTYSWASWVEKAGEKYEVDSGTLQILPNPSSATTLDLRTVAQKALDDAKAALAAWTPTTRRYQIGGRMMEFHTAADILPVVDYWKTEVAREEAASRKAKGLPDKRRVFLRLGRA